ncbi:MAG: hypothetical protein ACE5EF_13115, partial [Dehalococcoidia bacterium]
PGEPVELLVGALARALLGLGDVQQGAAASQLLGTTAVGEEPIMADPHEVTLPRFSGQVDCAR